ncbi:hypothetical protein C2845_PM01G19570 [Panicum miliaceum]|uniref:KIB1-4 beta-propeller domain-containing protein n=1 Tax=Panicum miliaceum TaxID=4540 RepID=A0A3L6TFI0_PANMI|nr:hypothetical protein C2845_PM01G19570 [Panicum miliaceum]
MAGRGWSSLPADLLHQVSGRLISERDLLHVHQVSLTGVPLPRSLSHPIGRGRIQIAGPPGLPYCCGTPRGWLALADDEQSPKRLVLWEPRSGTEIPVPPLGRVIQVFLSADPLASPPSSSGWMAVATQVRNELYHNIFFWCPGDAAWIAAAEVYTGERLHSVAFLGVKMYCIDFLKRFAIYDLNLGTGCPPVLLQRMYAAPLLNMLCNRRCGSKLHGTRAAHFVTCNGELLLVVLFNPRHPSFAEVYKPDLTPGQRLELGNELAEKYMYMEMIP